MKIERIIYWIATGLFCLLVLFSAGMYFFNYAEVTGVFESLGYPSYIVYPLACLKIAAVIVIVSNKSKSLKEWAYAGLFFDFVLAFFAHYMIKDGEHYAALVATVLLLVSYFIGKKVRP